jgi:uncharacterized protein involved in exopolysaccharide biosynthesis
VAAVPSASPSYALREVENEPRPLEFVNLLLRRRRLVLGLPLAASVLTLLVSLFVPPTYTATTTFVPEVGAVSRIPAGLSGLGSLAGQFGITLSGDASQSPQFYADLIESRELMERVLRSRYSIPSGKATPADSAMLLEILDVHGKNPADSLYRGVKKLRKLVSSAVDRKTNVVQLSVDAHDPALAALVANRFLIYLNEFNAKTRQSQARERRKFAEDRLAQADSDLHRAEEELKAFYQRNRSWQQAPQLAFEEARLRRQVDIRQEVYLTLRREYETARIDEANDTPVITVIDAAVAPTSKSKPKRLVWVIVALALGGVVSITSAVAADHAERLQREDDGTYREFRGLLGDIHHGLARIGARIRTQPKR